MPDIALFIVASTLLALAPGPDIVYVLTRVQRDEDSILPRARAAGEPV